MSAPPFVTAESLSGTVHGFFGRRGGVSGGLYDSLNVGQGSGDDPANVEANRDLVRRTLGAEALLSCYQVHSAKVVEVSAPWDARPDADAMVTTMPGLALCILTADCTPVLFADPRARIIGAAHAGWKGAIGGVLEATVAAMVRLGADPDHIRAAIGPTIQQASYEVGPEFRDTFTAEEPDAGSLFIPGEGDRFHFDLPGFCARRLDAAGVAQVEIIHHDTCALEDIYFSNRRRNHRSEPDYGRNASVILLNP